MKPLILMTARYEQKEYNDVYYDNVSYFRYVKENGGMPVLAPFVTTEEEAQGYAERFDGLLITGGEDADPSLYGEANTDSKDVNPAMDAADILLYHAFREKGKPVLGICRGIQMINIADQGTLYQDLVKQAPSHKEHNQFRLGKRNGKHDYCHDDVFEEGSILYSIYGKKAMVNSFHHQAVKDAAEGFMVSAVSEDGIIEGIEKENVIAVQWHPERLADEGSAALMQYFLKLCSTE
ncbi:MAG: gamma-glutamyl-gamma-aminobutyrate hydrolase family protein [Bulleidia sp.]|nr:gamma-glutamyl-gamma-aminobutyrate hydrolase family protein [Bulleidia sp.]